MNNVIVRWVGFFLYMVCLTTMVGLGCYAPGITNDGKVAIVFVGCIVALLSVGALFTVEYESVSHEENS